MTPYSLLNIKELIKMAINQLFLTKFANSVQLKNWGLLSSSLKMRQEATESMKDDPGHFALGKANEHVLHYAHIGDGLNAYATVSEALGNFKDFVEIDKEWRIAAGFSLVTDCLSFAGNLADTWERAETFQRRLLELDPSEPRNAQRLEQIQSLRQKGAKWWDTQLGVAHVHYSRTSPELDQGKYQQAMSILHCVLARAIDSQDAYDLDEDTVYDILDDYLLLSNESYKITLARYHQALKSGAFADTMDGPKEQFLIFEKPLEIWLELMPDCPPKFKPIFNAFYELLKQSPYPIYPSILDKLGQYFPNASVKVQVCPECGKENSQISSICIYCGSRLQKSSKKGFKNLIKTLFGQR
jgi:hypothetical protein